MKCPYIDGCPSYQATGYNCNKDGGGPFCSEWRTRKQIDDIVNHRTRIAFIIITTAIIIICAAAAYILEALRP